MVMVVWVGWWLWGWEGGCSDGGGYGGWEGGSGDGGGMYRLNTYCNSYFN